MPTVVVDDIDAFTRISREGLKLIFIVAAPPYEQRLGISREGLKPLRCVQCNYDDNIAMNLKRRIETTSFPRVLLSFLTRVESQEKD